MHGKSTRDGHFSLEVFPTVWEKGAIGAKPLTCPFSKVVTNGFLYFKEEISQK